MQTDDFHHHTTFPRNAEMSYRIPLRLISFHFYLFSKFCFGIAQTLCPVASLIFFFFVCVFMFFMLCVLISV